MSRASPFQNKYVHTDPKTPNEARAPRGPLFFFFFEVLKFECKNYKKVEKHYDVGNVALYHSVNF
jgi:hypothetical protein